ncbi:CYTH domain-containing protein [Bacillus massiliglaciei]|uniref:CYTH domain-containing protein n=1 Tax=Bacillus massiliglaciei TaxID=1816693 RepID=UPI000DA63B4B|nr:CYTH domain-containing protein [Bacillus massiliglaciei]
MDQHIEIECKNLITKEEFIQITDDFNIAPSDFAVQTNYYFDTPSFHLKEQQSALRIREKDGTFELTLKQPADEGLLESNQQINRQEADLFLQHEQFPKGQIESLLLQQGINPEEIICFGSLKTERAEIPFKGGLLVFDRSMYEGKEDFELEYEVSDRQTGEGIFFQLLKTLNIPLRPTENKVRRFYRAKFGGGEADENPRF